MVARQGVGVYTSRDGVVYDGEWEGDLMSGNGKLTQTNGSCYEVKTTSCTLSLRALNYHNAFFCESQDVRYFLTTVPEQKP